MSDNNTKTTTIWLGRAIAYVVFAFIVVSQLILVQGFLLLLLGANPGNDYVDWAYRSLDRVMEPFRGIFTPIEFEGNSVLDTSILFAMVIYGIALLLMRALLDWLSDKLHKAERDRELQRAIDAAAANQPYPGVTSDGTPVIVPTQPTHPTQPEHPTQPSPQQPGGTPPPPPR